MTFAPEWVEGSPSLVGRDDTLRFWVHLAFMNGLWVLVPAILLAESCVQITAACAKAKTGAAPAALPAAAYHACAGSLLAYAVLVPAICGAMALGKL
jgi:Sec-independent protein secretion pathway component TatC